MIILDEKMILGEKMIFILLLLKKLTASTSTHNQCFRAKKERDEMHTPVHPSFTMRAFGVLPMVPLEILPMVPLVANGTIGSQWYHWLTIGTIGSANGTIGITNGTIGRTLNDIGIPLVPLVEP